MSKKQARPCSERCEKAAKTCIHLTYKRFSSISWTYLDFFWFLLIFLFPLIFLDFSWFFPIFLIFHNFSWFFMIFHDFFISFDFFWFFLTFHDFSWFLMIFPNFPWFFLIFFIPLIFLDFSWFFPIFHDFSWFFPNFHDFSWFFMIFPDLFIFPKSLSQTQFDDCLKHQHTCAHNYVHTQKHKCMHVIMIPPQHTPPITHTYPTPMIEESNN